MGIANIPPDIAKSFGSYSRRGKGVHIEYLGDLRKRIYQSWAGFFSVFKARQSLHTIRIRPLAQHGRREKRQARWYILFRKQPYQLQDCECHFSPIQTGNKDSISR